MLASQPTFSPVAQAFQNTAAGIGAARNAREAALLRDRLAPTYGAAGSKGSGRVVN